MPKYRVLQKSFIDNTIREEGEIVEYDGKPGSNLELVTEEPKAKVAKSPKGGDANDDLV